MGKIPGSKSSATRVVAIQALFLGVMHVRLASHLPGGRVFPIMAYTGTLFHASGIWKGRDFAS